MSGTDLLREAARLMRERAEAVYPPQLDWRRLVMAHSGTALDHALHWSPAVALAVADWLDESAGHLDQHIPAWTAPSRGVDDPPAVAWDSPERLAALVEHHFGRPLAVARAYLDDAR